MARARGSGAPASTRSPVSPSITTSGTAETRVAITGKRAAMASRKTSPSPSHREASTNASETAYSSGTSRRMPAKTQSGPRPSSAARASLRARPLPKGSSPTSNRRRRGSSALRWSRAMRKALNRTVVGLLRGRSARRTRARNRRPRNPARRAVAGAARSRGRARRARGRCRSRLRVWRESGTRPWRSMKRPTWSDSTIVRRGQPADQAVQTGDDGSLEHLLVVVLARDQGPAATGERGRQGRRNVGLEQVRVHALRPAQVRPQAREQGRSRTDSAGPLRPRGAEVLGQRAATLEPGHAHPVAAPRLPAHQAEQVHLRAPHVQGRDHVQDAHAHATSAYTSSTRSTMPDRVCSAPARARDPRHPGRDGRPGPARAGVALRLPNRPDPRSAPGNRCTPRARRRAPRRRRSRPPAARRPWLRARRRACLPSARGNHRKSQLANRAGASSRQPRKRTRAPTPRSSARRSSSARCSPRPIMSRCTRSRPGCASARSATSCPLATWCSPATTASGTSSGTSSPARGSGRA